MDENELYKLKTRRWLAWGVGGTFTTAVCFIAVWGAITGVTELVTLAMGIAGTSIGTILGFYFGKKVAEE